MYSSTISLTSTLGWRGGVVNTTSRPLYTGERPGSLCVVGSLGPGPVWSGVANLASHRDSIPGPSSPWQVAVPTELYNACHRNIGT
jgi:hypothetical protein